MINRKKAEWIEKDKIVLLIDSKELKEIKKRVLERDGYNCYICECNLKNKKITYDHILPRTRGGTDFEDNLSVCCERCNVKKADMTIDNFSLYLFIESLLILSKSHKLSLVNMFV